MKQSPKRLLPLAIAVAIASILASGCGSDSSEGETTSALTKAQLTKQVDQICMQGLKEKDKLVDTALKNFSKSELSSPSDKQLEALAQSLLPPFQQMSEELSELPVSEDAEAVQEVADELEAGVEKAEADPNRLLETNPFQAAGEAAQGHGFEACTF